MQSTHKKILTTLVGVFACAVVAQAGGIALPPDHSSPELQRIKSLAGRWRTETSMFGKKNQKMFTEYHITAGGSAVMERIFPGTPYEMVSMYYDDATGKLAMTHYCVMRNRPTLQLTNSTSDTITLGQVKGAHAKSPSKDEPSMNALAIRFTDNDHLSTTCGGTGEGKDTSGPMTMEFTRVKK